MQRTGDYFRKGRFSRQFWQPRNWLACCITIKNNYLFHITVVQMAFKQQQQKSCSFQVLLWRNGKKVTVKYSSHVSLLPATYQHSQSSPTSLLCLLGQETSLANSRTEHEASWKLGNSAISILQTPALHKYETLNTLFHSAYKEIWGTSFKINEGFKTLTN